VYDSHFPDFHRSSIHSVDGVLVPAEREVMYSFLHRASAAEIASAFEDGRLSTWLMGLELEEMVGCDQGRRKHLEGPVHVHTGLVVENARNLRATFESHPLFSIGKYSDMDTLAALLHDMRKPHTREEGEGGAVEFPGHEERALGCLHKVQKLLNLTRRADGDLTVPYRRARKRSWL
jgi:hypothetical protein